jgi:hypothetical protein
LMSEGRGFRITTVVRGIPVIPTMRINAKRTAKRAGRSL